MGEEEALGFAQGKIVKRTNGSFCGTQKALTKVRKVSGAGTISYVRNVVVSRQAAFNPFSSES
jgi:hypothetical protein